MRAWMLGVLTAATAGCRPAPPPIAAPAPRCPEPQAAVAPEPEPPPPEPELTAESEPEPEPLDLEWGFVEAGDLQPYALDELRIRVAPAEREADDGSLTLVSHVTIEDDVGVLSTFEHPMDTGYCGGELTTAVERVGAGRNVDVYDAQLTCRVGESHPRWNTSHTVFSFDASARTLTLLVFAEAGSWIVVEESQDVRTLRFVIEANTLAMYEEQSQWCDQEAVLEAHGVRERNCKVRPRTLRLRERVQLP